MFNTFISPFGIQFRVIHVKYINKFTDTTTLINSNVEVLPWDKIDGLKRFIILRGYYQ